MVPAAFPVMTILMLVFFFQGFFFAIRGVIYPKALRQNQYDRSLNYTLLAKLIALFCLPYKNTG